MDDSTRDRITAFETRMNVSPSALAREELIAGKRWTLLEAVGFLASGENAIVDQVRELCPPLNALPHHSAADATSIHLTRILDERQALNSECSSFEDAMRGLLEALKRGKITAYVNTKPTSLEGLEFREFVYSANMIGLSPRPPGDGRFWDSVLVNAVDVRRLRSNLSSSAQPADARPAIATGAKRGPKPKWDWLNLMGEIVRIADQDGIDTIGGQSDVERWASIWLAAAAGTDGGPAESLVREHIAPIFDAIKNHNNSKLEKKPAA